MRKKCRKIEIRVFSESRILGEILSAEAANRQNLNVGRRDCPHDVITFKMLVSYFGLKITVMEMKRNEN